MRRDTDREQQPMTVDYTQLNTVRAELGLSSISDENTSFSRVTPSTRKDKAKKGQALPDGSYPISDEADLRRAIKAYGRAKNKTQVRKHIIKRARALGRSDLLPNTPDWRTATGAIKASGANAQGTGDGSLSTSPLFGMKIAAVRGNEILYTDPGADLDDPDTLCVVVSRTSGQVLRGPDTVGVVFGDDD